MAGIPLPQGDAFDSFAKGFHLPDNLMRQILARNQLSQQGEQFNKHHAQQEEHFKQQMDLRRAQMARAGMNSDLQRAIMQQQLVGLQHKNDPLYEMQQLQAMQNMFGGGNPQQAMQQEPQMPPPSQEMGEGMGMYSPEGMQEAQQVPQQPVPQQAPQGGINMEAIKNSPIMRGYFKKHFGVDPGADMNRPLQGPARNAADLERLRKELGRDHPVVQQAEAEYDANIEAKKDLRDLRARTKAGLKPGEKEFFDQQSGIPLGKEIPLNAKERESEEGNILFNELYPYVYNGASPFSGEGSITRLENAARNYKTDPKARKLFDDFLLSEKMLAATTVNEASTLKAGRTNRTYNMLKESLDAQDIPNLVKKFVKQYQIPSSASMHASMRYQKILSDARKKARKGTPATQRLFYNPEMQAKHEEERNEVSTSPKGEIKMLGGKRYEKIDGEWHEVH